MKDLNYLEFWDDWVRRAPKRQGSAQSMQYLAATRAWSRSATKKSHFSLRLQVWLFSHSWTEWRVTPNCHISCNAGFFTSLQTPLPLSVSNTAGVLRPMPLTAGRLWILSLALCERIRRRRMYDRMTWTVRCSCDPQPTQARERPFMPNLVIKKRKHNDLVDTRLHRPSLVPSNSYPSFHFHLHFDTLPAHVILLSPKSYTLYTYLSTEAWIKAFA